MSLVHKATKAPAADETTKAAEAEAKKELYYLAFAVLGTLFVMSALMVSDMPHVIECSLILF